MSDTESGLVESAVLRAAAADLVTIAAENLGTFLADAGPMLLEHWRELATYKDIPLQVDADTYDQMEASGRLVIITMRMEHLLCGYVTFVIGPHPHYKESKQALEDVLYIAPALRKLGLGRRLLRETERILRDMGVQTVHHAVKLTHPALGTLLESEDYRPIETVYSKRLD